MPLAITEDHRALAEVAAAMVAGRAGTASARRILLDRDKRGRWWSTDRLWKEMVSTGWLGLHVDEQFDGQGYGVSELTIVLEQLGRAAVGGPFLPTVVVSAVIAEAGTDQQRERWLPRLVSGDVVAGIGTRSDAAVHDSAISAAAVPALAEAGADPMVPPQWFAMWARRHQYEYGSAARIWGTSRSRNATTRDPTSTLCDASR
jgi:alkylation response protein AidB-like acyl-CoA dehydrogenase